MFVKGTFFLWVVGFSQALNFPMTYTCATNARQQYDMFFPVLCPKGCASRTYGVWGNGVYTRDSSICRAAIHDGRITDEGGEVIVYQQPGQISYVGVDKHSIKSSSYGYYRGSFTFTPKIPDSPITCDTAIEDKRFELLTDFQITCPPGCLDSPGKVYGNAIYSYHSSICTAAIHDEKLSNEGGEVAVYTQPGQASYKGIKRNSVTSSDWKYSHISFSFTPDVIGVDDPPVSCFITGLDTRFTVQASLNLTCPPGCVSFEEGVWGSGVYTEDTAICRAAIHDGRLTNEEGGIVTFYRQLGQSSYIGLEKNSIKSSPYGYWRRSFSFEAKTPDPPDCTTTAEDSRFFKEKRFQFSCLPSCAETTKAIWGNVLYTTDSSICKAAIHDGRLLNGDGGIVTVYIQPGQHSYDGTERNSVKSLPHGPSSLSFSFTVNGTDYPDSTTASPDQPGGRNDDALYALIIIPVLLVIIFGVLLWRTCQRRRRYMRFSDV
ncbi:unnamed protein product [Clavelina lepadiformis]